MQRLLFYSSTIIIAGVMVFNIARQAPVVANYAAAADERIVLLKELNETGQSDMVLLEPLPSSGMLYSAEITADSLHHTNLHLKKALRLNFSIKLKKK